MQEETRHHEHRTELATPIGTDPVCGMKGPLASVHHDSLNGTDAVFCSALCRDRFASDPSNAPVHREKEPSITRPKRPSAKAPMHPEIVRDSPPSCPIYGMALKLKAASASTDEESHELRDMIASTSVIHVELRDNLEALRQVLVPIAPLSPRPLPASAAVSPPSMARAMPPQSSGGAMSGASMMGGGDDANNGGMGMGTARAPSGGSPSAGKEKVASEVKLPAGYFLKWTGQYEFLERVRARMAWILPLTLALVFVILYVNFKGAAQSLIVMTSVPFAAVGAIWTLWFAGFNTSIAVWVGMIALLGVAAETASVMVVYLDDAWNEGRKNATLANLPDLIAQSLEAGAKRVRPLLMTVMANVFGLLPILLDNGVGSDVAKRIAAPMWGGLVSLTTLTLLVIPAIYVVWRSFHLHPASGGDAPPPRVRAPKEATS